MRRFEGPSWRLEKRGEQFYRATAELGTHPVTGRRWRESQSFRGTKAAAKTAAEQWFAALNERVSDPERVGSAEQPLSRYLNSWLQSKRGTVKESAWRRYDSLIRTSVSPALGHVRLCDLSPQHLREYVANCRLEPSRQHPDQMVSSKTLANRLGALNTALRQAVKEGIIPRNPLDAIDKPRGTSSSLRTVGEHEAATIRRASEGSDLEPIVMLALATGARLGELLGLRWRDADLERGVLHITRTLSELPIASSADWYSFTEPKGGRGRSVDIDPPTVEALKRHKARQSELRLSLGRAWQDQGLIFPNTWQLRAVAPGSPLRVTTVSRQFRKLATDAALPGVRFHDLRHAHATIMLRAGVPVHVVAQRLGHSDPAMTLRVYSHVLPGQQHDAAALVGQAIQKALAAL